MTRRKHEIPETGEPGQESVEIPASEPSALMATAADAAQEGAEDAKRAAAEVLPAFGKWVSESVYGVFYYASFGVVFGALTVARIVPANNLIVNALRDGALAARLAVERGAARAEAKAEPAEAGADPSVLSA